LKMLRLRSSRLARVAGAAILLAALGSARALAQEDPPEAADRLRAGIDEDLQDRAAEQTVPKPKRTGAPVQSPPSGSGAGQTGYLSTNLPRPKPKAGLKTGRNSPGTGQGLAKAKPGPGAARGNGAATRSGKIPTVNRRAASARKTLASARAGGPEAASPGAAGPIPSRPPKPTVEEDAFAPLGIRAGAFLLRPALEVTAGHDSNPARVSDASSRRSSK
jgi:hypothetical protein